MLSNIIIWSVQNRFLVMLSATLLTALGLYSVTQTSLDAIPDLSDTQVIIKTPYPGQAPQVVEDQVTYPLASTMLSVPGAKVVRGYSFFGDSYVYIIFEDGTDLYWARSRVLEYLNQISQNLPAAATPALGPDATGVGWIYEYALLDKSGHHDLAQLRSLQDWFLKYELQTIKGVAEVASVGGMVKQYQVIVEPDRLRAFGVSLQTVIEAIQKSNAEVGGSVIEIAEAEYMIRSHGYLSRREDIEVIPVGVPKQGTPILLRDIARIQIGPQMRRGIAELNGEGEVVGGIIVMRSGENPLAVIKRVKHKLETLQSGLPQGVEIIETYDRSPLIQRSIQTLSQRLLEEFLVVALVCLLFLRHWRSAWVAIVSLPLGILIAFIIMRQQGITANIMSLGGIAIAIGAMVDAAVVMVENTHRHLERWHQEHQRTPNTNEHWRIIVDAASEVGPALFFSLLIITLSFVPVFALQAQEGRLFAPLAYTKTYAMAAAAVLAITLIPVMMGYFIRGKIQREQDNSLNRWLIKRYRPLLHYQLQHPWRSLILLLIICVLLLIPYRFLATEFMPTLREGHLMYMPTTLPGLSVGKAQELLQQTDRLIAKVPEVEHVFGKIGRAETATDPAPLTMIETLIEFKPEHEWRAGMTWEKLLQELDQQVQLPGVTNSWTQPIRTRIDMLATGLKTPLGLKIAGDDLQEIQRIGTEIEAQLQDLPGTLSVYAERAVAGRYVEIIPDRRRAARFGLNIDAINHIISTAVGGANITYTIEGRARYPVNLRYPRDRRDHIDALKNLPLVTPSGAHIALSHIAEIRISEGPPMIKTENARLNAWVFIETDAVDLNTYIQGAQQRIDTQVLLPIGYSVNWTGQYEYLQRAQQRLQWIIPFSLAITFILLYLIFKSAGDASLVMLSMPLALGGSIMFLWLLDYALSVAVIIGMIALAGVAAEFGVIMLLYIKNSVQEFKRSNKLHSCADLQAAIMEGAVLRVRPKAMTAAVILAGLLPIMLGHGSGSEVMRRIAAPMLGGMVTAPLLSLFALPLAYYLIHRRQLN